MEWLSSPEAWISLATLTILEIVLGIDNIVFISILADRVEPEQRSRARQVGLMLAMGTRIALLVSIVWIMKLTAPLFAVLGHEVSGRDLILLAGGPPGSLLPSSPPSSRSRCWTSCSPWIR